MVRIKKLQDIITNDSIVIVSENNLWDVINIDSQAKSKIERVFFAEIQNNNEDILFVSAKGYIRKVYAVGSRDNVLFVTEKCNNKCLMCSQPPMEKDDISFYLKLNNVILNNIPLNTPILGISGGEPTLLGLGLPTLIARVYEVNPEIAVHVLSNGRNFKEKAYVECFELFGEKDLMIGIPLHSDYFLDHDLIAGKEGVFYETMQGIYNLALYGINIEIRVVINKINYRRLPEIASYIYKNIPFASHVAFMGMEYTGLAIKNKDQIQLNVKDYAQELQEAVLNLSDWGVNVSIYNIPLCLIPHTIHCYARRSISDWKESFIEKCSACTLRSECCGVFSTSKFIDPDINTQ